MNIGIPQPVITRGYARNIWITTEDFVFYIDGTRYVIPKGYVFDGYSIPRILHFWRSNNNGLGLEASAVHDLFYQFSELFEISRKFADKAFLEIMKMYGLRSRWLKYPAVRMFGWATRLSSRSGTGRPSRRVRRAMSNNGDDWREYRDLVIKANSLND